ncbi:NADH-quinone oxidoreductase subunit C [Candidatus Omnitrophota bacterium]
MSEKQKTINIEKNDLIAKVKELKSSGHRLVQIGCTTLQDFEINYSFDKNYDFLNLKLVVPKDGAEIPSISGIYWSAFLYENELHDLFGINVKDMAIDYKGNFYKTAVKTPFRFGSSQKEGGVASE